MKAKILYHISGTLGEKCFALRRSMAIDSYRRLSIDCCRRLSTAIDRLQSTAVDGYRLIAIDGHRWQSGRHAAVAARSKPIPNNPVNSVNPVKT